MREDLIWNILPPQEHLCLVCGADKHDDSLPHNRDSLFFQIAFSAEHGRPPTWADAAKDCPPDVKSRLWLFLLDNNISPDLIGNFDDEPTPKTP